MVVISEIRTTSKCYEMMEQQQTLTVSTCRPGKFITEFKTKILAKIKKKPSHLLLYIH